MLDLARELSREDDQPLATQPPGLTPADFWQRRLSGWTAPTPLICTIPSPNPNATGASIRSETLSESATERLRRAAREMGVPQAIFFTGTWALLLHRYCGEDDIVFGIVKSCVERGAECEPHIIPARVIFQADARVTQWFRELAERAREAAPFEFTSLDQIRTAANVASDIPLFQSVLSVGNDFDPASITSGGTEPNRYPLVAAVYPGRDTTLSVSFSKAKFSEEAIQLLLGHWITLLESVASAREELLSTLRMVTNSEIEKLVVEWNENAVPYPRAATIPHLFEQQVERTPDAVAVQFGQRSLRYRELNYRANALANHLRTLGVRNDSVVGISMERSVEAAVAVIAVLKAGAAYLPLDPAYPHERLKFMLADSQASVLITQPHLRELFDAASGDSTTRNSQRSTLNHLLLLDEAWFESCRASRENPEPVATAESLAYLIYTSGSTGKPKGVAMIHRPLVNLIDWQTKQSPLGVGDRTLQFTSMSFDVSFQEMFSTWCSGGTLVQISADLRLSPRDLWSFIEREKITRIFLPFVALQQLADAAAAELSTASGLREVITAGEQLQVTPRLRELFSRHPEATLHNHYGPSETHVVTALALRGTPDTWPVLPTIGRPIQNTSICLLDKHMVPVPVGVPGELFIGGDALARGYFQRPDVTAEKFIAWPEHLPVPLRKERNDSTNQRSNDSTTESAGASATHSQLSTLSSQLVPRLYRTGDLARYLPDGNIEFLGRIDHQVKIRGYRVELGEIEAALNKIPGVRECVVMARELEGGLKQLVGYIVREPGTNLQPQPLRQELKQHLPEYMVPASLVFLEKLPLTPSGKVDRRSLPAPELSALNSQLSTSQPATGEKPWLPLQLQLVQIWEDLLKVRPIGIRDNFFDLGGHSLLAVKMMDRVEQVTGKKLPVTELFKDATVAHLSDLILQVKENGAPPEGASPVIELRTDGTHTPMYFLHGDIIGGGFYARDLARLMGDDQPFYVLPPSGMDNGALTSVEEMTALHLRDLRAHRPHGPYVLAGFCIGALIAYEMAVRLRADGEEVPWIALIDPQLPSGLLRAHFRMTQRAAARHSLTDEQKLARFARGYKILYRLREEWNSPLREKFQFIARKLHIRNTPSLHHSTAPLSSNTSATESDSTMQPFNNSTSADSTPPVRKEFADREQRILAAFHWILSSYTPPHYDGPLTMFLTDEQQALTPFIARRWRSAAPRLQVERIPGKHLEAITTGVESFAARFRDQLFAHA